MPDSIVSKLTTARKLFSETSTDDPKIISDYGWTFVKALHQNLSEIDSVTARQMLADCIKLQMERPSKFHSALLSAAIKVAQKYPEFHFASFLKMWGVENFRQDDKMQHKSGDGKVFLSLEEQSIRTLAYSLLIHPEDRLTLQTSGFEALLSSSAMSLHPMLVTRIKQATGKDGRKYTFVTLTSPDGIEVECISHALKVSPLHPLPEGKRHYVNIGQIYDILLRKKTLSEYSIMASCLSNMRPDEIFPIEIGYIEHIDAEHSHMHVYDCHSRHFVAPVLRFSREKEGNFVRFVPIIPQTSKFKSAIILGTVSSSSEEVQNVLREIRITHINKEKGYAAWELVNKENPITELLSPFQLLQGEKSPTFTSGYIHLEETSPLLKSPFEGNVEGNAFIYLRRGKDKQKHPHIAEIF